VVEVDYPRHTTAVLERVEPSYTLSTSGATPSAGLPQRRLAYSAETRHRANYIQPDEEVVNAYERRGSVRGVEEELKVGVWRVSRALRRECGAPYGLRGVCRLYLAVRGRRFITVSEARGSLGRPSRTCTIV